MAAAPGTLSALVAAGSQSSSVSYATPSIAGFSANFQTTVSNRANDRQVLSLNYASGPLTAQYLNAKNGVAGFGNAALGAAITAGYDAAASDTKSNATFMGASYAFGFGRVNVGNTVNENAAGAKTSEITTLGASVPMGAYTLLAGYNKAKHIGTINANNDTKMGVGVTYALSKRTSVGADMFKQDAANSSTGFVARLRHTF
jgi:predicted porin